MDYRSIESQAMRVTNGGPEDLKHMPQIEIKRATSKTVSYLHILFNDIGYTPNQAILFCRNEFHNPRINHFDDMSQQEASHVIDRLKQIRATIRSRS